MGAALFHDLMNSRCHNKAWGRSWSIHAFRVKQDDNPKHLGVLVGPASRRSRWCGMDRRDAGPTEEKPGPSAMFGN
jgi:hypothetical protein